MTAQSIAYLKKIGVRASLVPGTQEVRIEPEGGHEFNRLSLALSKKIPSIHLILNFPATIKIGAGGYFDRKTNKLVMPYFDLLEGRSYSSLFHELVHAHAHIRRLQGKTSAFDVALVDIITSLNSNTNYMDFQSGEEALAFLWGTKARILKGKDEDPKMLIEYVNDPDLLEIFQSGRPLREFDLETSRFRFDLGSANYTARRNMGMVQEFFRNAPFEANINNERDSNGFYQAFATTTIAHNGRSEKLTFRIFLKDRPQNPSTAIVNQLMRLYYESKRIEKLTSALKVRSDSIQESRMLGSAAIKNLDLMNYPEVRDIANYKENDWNERRFEETRSELTNYNPEFVPAVFGEAHSFESPW